MDGFLLSELPSRHPNLLTQWSPTGQLRTSSATALKPFPTQKGSLSPLTLTVLKVMFLPAGLCSAFWKEFAFCPKLRSQPCKTFLKQWSFRHQSPDRDFSGRNEDLPQAGRALASALCCSHSQQLLAPLGSDSQGSSKMPYSLAVSLLKTKNGCTRPWHSRFLSLVTASFPGASASSSLKTLPSPQVLTPASVCPQLAQYPGAARPT